MTRRNRRSRAHRRRDKSQYRLSFSLHQRAKKPSYGNTVPQIANTMHTDMRGISALDDCYPTSFVSNNDGIVTMKD